MSSNVCTRSSRATTLDGQKTSVGLACGSVGSSSTEGPVLCPLTWQHDAITPCNLQRKKLRSLYRHAVQFTATFYRIASTCCQPCRETYKLSESFFTLSKTNKDRTPDPWPLTFQAAASGLCLSSAQSCVVLFTQFCPQRPQTNTCV